MSTPHNLEPINTSNLKADKALPAPQRHARIARSIIAGEESLPAAPNVAGLPELWNSAVLAINAHEAAAVDIDHCRAELAAAEVALAEATGSLHEGLSKAEALNIIRNARDAADLAGLAVRRAENVFEQVAGRRRNTLLDLANAVEAAGKAAATRAAVKVLEDIDTGLDLAVRERLGSELEEAVNFVVTCSGDVAAIGGRAAMLSDRMRDIRNTDHPTPDAIGYLMRSAREIIDLVTPPAPSAELPPDPILEAVTPSKTRRGFPKTKAA